MSDVTQNQLIAQNRRAQYDYFIDEQIEAGLVLYGTEIKSLRCGNASINEAYADVHADGLYLFNSYIPPYKQAHHLDQHEKRRVRKLLLHRRQIKKLLGAIRRKGITLVPISLYFTSRGIAKIHLGLARGKRKVDKRATIKEREWNRDKNRLMRDKGNSRFLKEKED